MYKDDLNKDISEGNGKQENVLEDLKSARGVARICIYPQTPKRTNNTILYVHKLNNGSAIICSKIFFFNKFLQKKDFFLRFY